MSHKLHPLSPMERSICAKLFVCWFASVWLCGNFHFLSSMHTKLHTK